MEEVDKGYLVSRMGEWVNELFWFWPIRVVPDQGPSNGCECVWVLQQEQFHIHYIDQSVSVILNNEYGKNFLLWSKAIHPICQQFQFIQISSKNPSVCSSLISTVFLPPIATARGSDSSLVLGCRACFQMVCIYVCCLYFSGMLLCWTMLVNMKEQRKEYQKHSK